MDYLISFQSVVFILYLYYIMRKYGVLPSISDSYYAMGKKKHLFMLFIWAIALPLCFMGNLWFFLAGAFLCFTGAAAEFKESMTGKVHGVGAVGGITLCCYGLLKAQIYWPIVVGVVISLLLHYLKAKNETWWVEKTWFVLIILGLREYFN